MKFKLEHGNINAVTSSTAVTAKTTSYWEKDSFFFFLVRKLDLLLPPRGQVRTYQMEVGDLETLVM